MLMLCVFRLIVVNWGRSTQCFLGADTEDIPAIANVVADLPFLVV